MPLWKNLDQANHAPKFVAMSINEGAGAAAKAANNTALYGNVTVGAFKNNMAIGVFAASIAELANNSGEGKKTAAPGWQLRRAWSGPIVGVAIANTGATFANGETALLSGGSVNATATLTTNSTGGLTSASVSGSKGTFTNVSSIVVAFNREKHAANVLVTGGSGYLNTDTLRVSNGTVNATATISTNSTGGFQNATITLTNVGLFANNQTNAALVVTALAANGSPSVGTGATLTATLANSTNGGLTPSLGGRAGRVHYECLVVQRTIANNANATNTYLPHA